MISQEVYEALTKRVFDLEQRLELAANNTAAADLAQEIEYLRAEKDAEIERYRQAYELEHKMKCIALDDRDKARAEYKEGMRQLESLVSLEAVEDFLKSLEFSDKCDGDAITLVFGNIRHFAWIIRNEVDRLMPIKDGHHE